MPFSGPSSYLPTIDEFIGHWTDVNAALDPLTPLVLSGAYGLPELQADRDALAVEITELTAAINVLEGHRTDRNLRKDPMRERMRQLGSYIKGFLPDSVYVGQIPNLIKYDANPGKWIIAMDDNEHLWTTIEASPPSGFTPPLVLNGPYGLADFTGDVAALKTTFTDWVQAEQDTDRERDERDALYHDIRDRLVQYRMAVPGLFPADHPLVTSLPRLSPLPGHTPDPVILSGVWNESTSMADLSWTESPEGDLKEYEIRRSGSDPYDTSTELVVASLPPGTLAHSTNEGLTTIGATMRFKVYVVLNTGNEKGSNAVEITHTVEAPPPGP